MAAVNCQGSVNTPKNTKNAGVLCTSGSQCYSSTQSDVQALVNEVKSMSATINILMEELKYVSVNEGTRKPISTYAEKLKSGPNPCGKCAQSESQLQAALDELNSVKLINNILHEEIKLLTQSSYEVSNDINSWTIAKPSRSTTTRTSKTTHTSPGLVNDNSMQQIVYY